MNLLIISHMHHYIQDGDIVGWGPTVQEIDALAQIFDQVRHIAWLHSGQAPASSLPYSSNRVQLIGVPPSGGNNIKEKLNILKHFPVYIRTILKELPAADVVHVRCPANISMLAIFLLALVRYPRYHWVKYAGNWRPDNTNYSTYALQRWWLAKGLHSGVVSINGHWSNQPKHVYSFLNPSLTPDEIQHAKIQNSKVLSPPFQLLFVGALNNSKGVDRAILIAKQLKEREISFELNIFGDSPDRDAYEALVLELDINDCVHFHGWVPKSDLLEYYTRAHILLHPTNSDGWPKVISEAMAFGAVPIAGAVSSIPEILNKTKAGLAIPPHNINEFVGSILDYINQPEKWLKASRSGMQSAHLFTYEHYLKAVREMFKDYWGIEL